MSKNNTGSPARTRAPRAKSSAQTEAEQKFDPVAEALKLLKDTTLGKNSLRGSFIVVTKPYQQTFLLRSHAFEEWLRNEFHCHHNRILGKEHYGVVLAVLLSQARANGVEDELDVRVAGSSDELILIDLCNQKGQVIKVNGEGYEIVTKCGARFLRPTGMQALPVPVANKYSLRDYLAALFPDLSATNLALVGAFIISSFLPRLAKPFLQLLGGKGSGKSTASQIIRNIIDPNAAPSRSIGKNERDLIIAVNNQWCPLFDNVSSISKEQSDILCRISTGGAFSVRRLYSDADEALFNVCRPMLFNGITDFMERSDLRDRGYLVVLDEVPPSRRLTEAAIYRRFNEYHAKLFDAVLRCIVHSMNVGTTLEFAEMPRMADAYRFLKGAEPVAGFEAGAFDKAFAADRETASQSVIDSSDVAQFVMRFMESRKPFIGTATQLLSDLRWQASDDLPFDPRRMPATPQHLTNELRRLVPDLKARGILVSFEKNRNNRLVKVERLPDEAVTVRDDP